MVDSNRLVEIRDRLVSQKALADSAKINNEKTVGLLKEKLALLDDASLERLQSNGFDVMWLKSIDWDKLGDPDYMRNIKRKNLEVITQIDNFLDRYLEDKN